MIHEEPNIKSNARYTKAEACRLLGICPRTLDRYARYFGEAPYTNKVTQRPVYYGRQLLRLWRCVT
jgi:hypothetical protein